jgi:3-phenylpropionate/trans-cinnamate dioxygenase ferredoxin reductase subunit
MSTHVIVGAGQAGAQAATAMRRAGFAGRIVLIGDEQSLPYERPPLSKGYLSQDSSKLDHFYEPAEFAALGIEVITGVTVDRIDPAGRRVSLSLGGDLPYDALVLATGSRPRRLVMPGHETALQLRTFEDAERLRSRLTRGASVLCIGAGVIGLEVAAAARQRGCSVTVVDVAGNIMGRSLDLPMATQLRELHESRGVRFMLGAEVAELADSSALLTTGERIAADVAIFGIGVDRRVELARDAGIAVNRGVLVDGKGQTSHAGVYAAGEVAEFWSELAGTHLALESWRHAQDHGALVGRVLAGADETYREVTWFWSDQYDVNIQLIGVTAGDRIADRVRRENGPGSHSVFYFDAAGSMVGAIAWNAPRDIMAATRIITQGRMVDASLLVDPGVSLQTIIRDRSALVQSG